MLLKNAKEFWLQFERQVSDFIEKQRAAVSRLKSSGGLRDRSGERASFMSEQFTLEEISRNSRAIKSDKAILPARAGIVNRLRNYFLACACFATHQDGAILWCNHLYRVEHGSKSRAGTNQT